MAKAAVLADNAAAAAGLAVAAKARPAADAASVVVVAEKATMTAVAAAAAVTIRAANGRFARAGPRVLIILLARQRSGGSATSLSLDKYARGLIREKDKNGDMMLQADEQRGLSGKNAAADLDKDGVITVDELVTTLSGNVPAAAAATTSGGGTDGARGDDSGSGEGGRRGGFGDRRRGRDRAGGDGEQGRGGSGGTAATRVYTALGAGGNSSASGAADKPRTYRFKRAADRLPATGLPSWFKSRDANGDGQVAMSEYSRTWSDRTVDEFRRYDLNNDGVVTAKEATGK